MFARKVLCLLAGVVILGALASSPTHAMGDNHRAYFTFSQPVHLPGVLLPAGTYVFELQEPVQSWNLVRVSNRKTSQTYFLAFTSPVYRAGGNLDTAIVLGESPAGTVAPINVWYPQGERIGRQFIY
jgi:hypothetical protein